MTPAEFDQWLREPQHRTLVMGVLNVTPDSFADGGRYAAPDAAIARAEQMAAEGADLIDLGGESTRPGSKPVPAEEQIRRVVPVLEAVAGRLPVVCSIDTTSAPTAEAALDAGAALINDISGARNDPAMLPLAAQRHVPIVLMHMQGTPTTMQDAPAYGDVVAEIRDFLAQHVANAQSSGVVPHRILVDPGIGFGKTIEHNLTLLRRQRELLSLNRPLVIGTSRKKFIGTLTGEPEPAHRLFGTVATTAWAVANGAAIVRVHDVRPNVQIVQMIEAIRNSGG